jgi:hypothetical protein
MPENAKITKKGQVVLKPVKSVAGSLSSYARKGLMPFKEAREKSWEEVIRERHGEKTHRR